VGGAAVVGAGVGGAAVVGAGVGGARVVGAGVGGAAVVGAGVVIPVGGSVVKSEPPQNLKVCPTPLS